MMAELENPNLTMSELGILEQKITNDSANFEDYEKLDAYLSALGLGTYLLNKMKEYSIYSYEEYALKSKGIEKNSSFHANIKGAALGVISALKSYLKTI